MSLGAEQDKTSPPLTNAPASSVAILRRSPSIYAWEWSNKWGFPQLLARPTLTMHVLFETSQGLATRKGHLNNSGVALVVHGEHMHFSIKCYGKYLSAKSTHNNE